jgi:hypothetical protein
MDEGKRRLLKALPLAAMAPALMLHVGEKDAQGFALAKEKKYVFKVNADLTQDEANGFRDILLEKGINATVISGDVEIYELS